MSRRGWPKSSRPCRYLVIGRGARSYLALYAYGALDDVVVVAALRAQREAGFGEV